MRIKRKEEAEESEVVIDSGITKRYRKEEQEKKIRRIYGYGRVQETPRGVRRNFIDQEV